MWIALWIIECAKISVLFPPPKSSPNESMVRESIKYWLVKDHYTFEDKGEYVALIPKVKDGVEMRFYRKGEDLLCDIYSQETLDWQTLPEPKEKK